MCLFLNPEIRQWIDIGAESLTAIGTVGAVIVALWLSRREQRTKIAVSAAVAHFVEPFQTFAESTELVTMTATNMGFSTVVVNSLCWRVGLLRRKVLYVALMQPMRWPTELPPKVLNHHGDWLTVQMLKTQFVDGLFYLLKQISEHPLPLLALCSVRAGFETSTKKRFFARPNWELRKLIREQFDAFKAPD